MSSDFDNIILLTDGYKVTHHRQYPSDTKIISSYFESRGGKFDEITFFGPQYYIKKYLVGRQVTADKIKEAKSYFTEYFGSDHFFNEEGWDYIRREYDGYLPVRISAVPEGTVVPPLNVLMTIENTDPKCFWLTNYLETLLVQSWYPCTVATQSRFMKKILKRFMEKTADPGTMSSVDFKLHDFGFRGVTCPEQAGIGGAAHLLNFKGTDTIPALIVARKYYHEHVAGFSIPAAEHSTICSWRKARETDAYRNMLIQFPTGLVAVVSDSYDIFNACENIWGEVLRNEVLARDGVLIIRPDSGDPPQTVVKVLEILGRKFGFRINSKGYRVLDNHVRVIQGDGIDIVMLEKVLDNMEKHKWSAENIAFGSGGGLLQKLNRDTNEYAFKCCSRTTIENEEIEVYKDPITDKGKISKRGKQMLVKRGNTYETVPYSRMGGAGYTRNELVTSLLNGNLLEDYSFASIRERCAI